MKVHPKVTEVAIRSAHHAHDYGLYITLAWFQHEFWWLVGMGGAVLVVVSIVQIFYVPEVD